MIVVSNASPLIAFARLDELALLAQIFEKIVIPKAVWAEVRHEEKAGGKAMSNAFWLDVQPVLHPQLVVELQEAGLDRGEAEAIVLALERKADLLLIDERKGRRVAVEHGLNITGTLGLLLIAKRKGLIPEIRPLMVRLQEKAIFRMGKDLYHLILVEAGEQQA